MQCSIIYRTPLWRLIHLQGIHSAYSNTGTGTKVYLKTFICIFSILVQSNDSIGYFLNLFKIQIYVVHSISFQPFFVLAFKIDVDSWKFSMLLLYMLWDDRRIFMISGLNKQLQQQLEYTLLKPGCHSKWISKMQSGHETTLEERYAIKFCFKLGRSATETYEMFQIAFRPSCMNLASVFGWHKRFKEDGESVRDDERCGRSREVNTPELIGQGVRVRVTMLRF